MNPLQARRPAGGYPASVCVVIAAHDAAATVGRAIASALAEPEVAEVIVVDDASRDATAEVARCHDDGSGRLIVEKLAHNAGPSHARNVAITRSQAPYLAVLDADDFVLPGRFAALLAVPEWDMIADNIVFVADPELSDADRDAIASHVIAPRQLSAAAFVEASISRRDRYKHELGFLKPVFSRAFLDIHGLRYAEAMRLSEDYDLYVRALIAGARFRLAETCGYVAVEHPGSLSSTHGERELLAIEAALAALLDSAGEDPTLRSALRRHRAQIARKRRHRTLLARNQAVGTPRALTEAARHPVDLAGTLADIAADKWRAARGLLPGGAAPSPPRLRFLV